jgi:hypothetical protein
MEWPILGTSAILWRGTSGTDDHLISCRVQSLADDVVGDHSGHQNRRLHPLSRGVVGPDLPASQTRCLVGDR